MAKFNPSSKAWQTVFFEESTDFGQLLNVCETVYDRFWISPLHEPDSINHAKHWHVIVRNNQQFKMLSDRSKFNQLVKVTGCNGYAEPTRKLNGSLAYLVHLNNPEKEQFEGKFSQVTTNSPEWLDEIVPIERGFDCLRWHQCHYPRSPRNLMEQLSREHVVNLARASKILRWYQNHPDAFEEEPPLGEPWGPSLDTVQVTLDDLLERIKKGA